MSVDPKTADNVWQLLNEARKDITAVDVRTTAHEAVCAERYKAINLKLNICLWGFGVLIAAQTLGIDVAIKTILKANGLTP